MRGSFQFAALVGLISLGFTNAVNNFTNPSLNTVIQAGGGATTISWVPDPSEPMISLLLINAQQTIVLINQGANTGSFIWDVPGNLPSGTYTMEIGAGPPTALTGSTTSQPFAVQPCQTCSSVASTAIFTPATSAQTGTTGKPSPSNTSQAQVTGTTSQRAVGNSATSSAETAASTSNSHAAPKGSSSQTGSAGESGSQSTGTPGAGEPPAGASAAGKVRISAKWMWIGGTVGMGLWMILN